MGSHQPQRLPRGLPNVINVYESTERALWAQRLGVEEEMLEEAVRFVGVELDAVRLYLSQFPSTDR